MTDDQPEPSKEFAFVEYREAANAYFTGVKIGYTTVKHYITVNGLFVALLGALIESKSGVLAAANEMVKWIPLFALAFSGSLLAAVRHYFNHLENCRKRCEDIEHIYGGKLFTRLGRIANRKATFNSDLGLFAIIGLIIALWICVAAKVHSPGFNF